MWDIPSQHAHACKYMYMCAMFVKNRTPLAYFFSFPYIHRFLKNTTVSNPCTYMICIQIRSCNFAGYVLQSVNHNVICSTSMLHIFWSRMNTYTQFFFTYFSDFHSKLINKYLFKRTYVVDFIVSLFVLAIVRMFAWPTHEDTKCLHVSVFHVNACTYTCVIFLIQIKKKKNRHYVFHKHLLR